MLNLIVLTANVIALALMGLRGGRPERIAAILITATILSEPLVVGVQFGTWRVGILAVNAMLLLGLWILTELSDRWWLILATAFQLLLVLSALMPLVAGTFAINTGVAVRLALWIAISGVLFLGVWEASAARRFAREARSP